MKNSIFITTSNIGPTSGGGHVCHNICQALKKSTNLKAIMALCDKFPTDLQVPCICTRPDCYKQQDNPFLFDYFTYWNLPKEHIDLAHFYGAPFGITAREIKKRNPHATILIDIPAHNLEESILEHQNMMGNYPYTHMTDPFLWKTYSEHIRQADIIISPSTVSSDYIRNSETFGKVLGHRQKHIPIVHIPHGTNLPKKEDIKPFPEKFTVATVSQNGCDKGQVYLVVAWKALENVFPSNLGYNCVVAGPHTERWNEYIKDQKIQNMQVGFAPNIADVYNNCTIYIHPSVTEGFAITVLEAMSHGRPIIVTDQTGAVDLVEDGKNGFVIPTRSPESIIGCIRWMHDNESECKKMGEAARKTAEKYDWSIIRKKYEAVYKAL